MYSIVPREVTTGKNEINSSRSAERSEFIIASRAVRGPRMVPSELNSQRSSIRWCAPYRHTVVWRHGAFFVSRQHLTFDWKRFSINDQRIHEELTCSFILCETVFTIGESQAISDAYGTEKQTQERWIQLPAVNPRRGRFDTEKSSGERTPTWNQSTRATKKETAATNSGLETTSLNEFQMLKFF